MSFQGVTAINQEKYNSVFGSQFAQSSKILAISEKSEATQLRPPETKINRELVFTSGLT